MTRVTELDDLGDLASATVRDLVGRAVLDGVRLDGADLSGVSVAQVRLLECALVDCTAATAELPGVTAVDVYVGGLKAVSYTHLTLPTTTLCRSRWSPYH